MKAPLRTKSIGTKVSESEFAALEATAGAAEMTLSEWVRDVLLASSVDAGGRWPKSSCQKNYPEYRGSASYLLPM